MFKKKTKKEEVKQENVKEEITKIETEKETKEAKKVIEVKQIKSSSSKLVLRNPLYTYKFWIKIVSAVLLIILGLMLLFKENEAQGIVLMFTGGVFIIYSIFRMVFLIKSLEKGASKALAIIEIIFDFVAGFLLVYLSVKTFGNTPEGILLFATQHYNIIIGLVLWLRGFIYFTTTILFYEKTDKFQLFVHIAIITFGSFLLGVKIKAESIALALAILSLISAVLVCGEGFFDYGKYRQQFKQPKDKKEKSKEENKGKETPAREDKKEIPSDAPNEQPIIEPNNDDRPYVN